MNSATLTLEFWQLLVLAVLPAIVGGLAGTLGAFWGPKWLQQIRERAEARNKKAAKIEELFAAISEHQHWLGIMDSIRIFGSNEPRTDSPFCKIEAISQVYFPEFCDQVDKLSIATMKYEKWQLERGKARIAGAGVEKLDEGFDDVLEPVVTARQQLLVSLRKYANK